MVQSEVAQVATTHQAQLSGLLLPCLAELPVLRGRTVPCTAQHRASICLIGDSEMHPGSRAAFLSSSCFSPVKRAEAINSSSWLTLNCSRCRQARQHLSGTPLVGMKWISSGIRLLPPQLAHTLDSPSWGSAAVVSLPECQGCPDPRLPRQQPCRAHRLCQPRGTSPRAAGTATPALFAGAHGTRRRLASPAQSNFGPGHGDVCSV
ncbi:hypothetical protein Q9966_002599 [Columba livia]|nr:hypothetical protein Q9966_002599 [Columba livia]